MFQKRKNDKWIRLSKGVPFYNVLAITAINETELAFIDAIKSCCIYKYNINTHKWTKWIKLPKKWTRIQNLTTSINNDKTKLYVYCMSRFLIQIDINKAQITFITSKKDEINYGYPYATSSICINNTFYTIDILQDKTHLISWNNKQKCFDEIDCKYKTKPWPPQVIKGQQIMTAYFTQTFQNFKSHSMVYYQKTQSLLIIGGLCNKKPSDIIYSYCVNSQSNEMTEFDVKLPFAMFGMDAFITKSQMYLIIVGGSYYRMNIENWSAVSNGIYILNLNTMIWSKSNVKLPRNEKYNSVLIDMDKNSKVFLVQTYIHRIIGEMYICNEITQLIASFYCGEMIHIVESETAIHYKISVDNLIISR